MDIEKTIDIHSIRDWWYVGNKFRAARSVLFFGCARTKSFLIGSLAGVRHLRAAIVI
ncbi:hypothetical protein [Paraburkholderia youngii]|uniref:Uncharacterized protein n=1 Tax=Paraburkholderia youngii TaxID=2782701 RepID=A0A7W8LEJ2_9BURK|nr:hypothetical protein [Paraburkholderia youngii]MBB5405545.1 hypothetical protein [Paraburkholderia youngii]